MLCTARPLPTQWLSTASRRALWWRQSISSPISDFQALRCIAILLIEIPMQSNCLGKRRHPSAALDRRQRRCTSSPNQQQGIGDTDDISEYVRLPDCVRNGLQVIPNVWHVYYMMEDAKVIDPIENFRALVDSYFIEPAKRFTRPRSKRLCRQNDPVLDSVRAQQQLPLLPKPFQEYLGPWETA